MRWVIILLIVLVACAPVYNPPKTPSTSKSNVKESVSVEVKELPIELPSTTVVQRRDGKDTIFGLSEDGRLLRIEKPDVTWQFRYVQGRLAEIYGPQNVSFEYDENRVANITYKEKNTWFLYDDGYVTKIAGEKTLNIDRDGNHLIRAVRRGASGKTAIDYDKEGRVKYITRGLITTNVYYDERDRIRNFDADDVKFILGYWRDNKLSSLTGKTFGPGVSVSYGPGSNPTEAKVLSEDDNSLFTANSKEDLYNVVDYYLYCSKVRRLPIMFEGLSYVFFQQYFGKGLAEYVMMNYKCLPFENK